MFYIYIYWLNFFILIFCFQLFCLWQKHPPPPHRVHPPPSPAPAPVREGGDREGEGEGGAVKRGSRSTYMTPAYTTVV
jgi:hypothetical protein